MSNSADSQAKNLLALIKSQQPKFTVGSDRVTISQNGSSYDIFFPPPTVTRTKTVINR